MSRFRRLLVPALIVLLGVVVFGRAKPPEDTIEKAIERGVAYLRHKQQSSGEFGGYGSGSTALAAITLLECGATSEDSAIVKAAESVRKDGPKQNQTYHMSLAIILFDRLGDPRDIPLIRELTARILEGQYKEGAWSYKSPAPTEEEEKRFLSLLGSRAEMKAGPPGAGRGEVPPPSPELQDKLDRLSRRKPNEGQSYPDMERGVGATYDNSNTQFAILALWVAHRYGLPVEPALRRAAGYFRAIQNKADGTWPYGSSMEALTGYGKSSMTCAGLLGLAIGTGVSRETRMKTAPEGKSGEPPPAVKDALKDAQVQAGMKYLGLSLQAAAARGLGTYEPLERDYYFLWSLERVASIYSVNVMAGMDWYKTGSSLLIKFQSDDGSWRGRYPEQVDTCFALLFLRRSNFAPDLTALLRSKPSSATLKAGDPKGPEAPPSKISPEAEKLARDLAAASPDKAGKIIEQLRDRKGAEYTEALVLAIASLKGEVLKQARDALAERLSRMTAATLRDKMQDVNPELRRAAVLAAAMQEDKTLIGDLIAVLDDSDPWVVRATGVALRTLTAQDFGPTATATPEERGRAVAAWKDWWKRSKGK